MVWGKVVPLVAAVTPRHVFWVKSSAVYWRAVPPESVNPKRDETGCT